MENNLNDTPSLKFWEFKKYAEHRWFARLVQLLVILVAMYLGLHLLADEILKKPNNYEYSKLNAKQIQQLNRIYFDSASVNVFAVRDTASQKNTADTGSAKKATDPVKDAAIQQTLKTERLNMLHEKALKYISNEFIYNADKSQLDSARKYLLLTAPVEAISFLSEFRFKVKSNFWLIGPWVYWEIVFWSWFGVISSLLFSIGIIGMNRTTDVNNPQTVFDSAEIPHQIAKLLYAPLCTLVIVFGYNFFQDQNVVDISSSKGVIAFAFIGGFYSSRLISFLDRLKEVVLPTSSTAGMQERTQGAVVAEIENIKIQLQPDPSISGDTRNEIAETGMNDAAVTVKNEQTGEAVSVSAPAEDQSDIFTVPKIKAGKYIVTASLSKEIGGEVINLDGSRTVEIKNADEVITLVLAKTESNG